jgi:hypothetical protein
MKSRLLGVIFLVALGGPGWADESSGGGAKKVLLGETNSLHAGSDETCVEVEIGGEKAEKLNCINEQLKQQVDRVQPVGNLPPLDASSPTVKLHGFNETALQQQYGKNLGKSVVPFRPAKP